MEMGIRYLSIMSRNSYLVCKRSISVDNYGYEIVSQDLVSKANRPLRNARHLFTIYAVDYKAAPVLS